MAGKIRERESESFDQKKKKFFFSSIRKKVFWITSVTEQWESEFLYGQKILKHYMLYSSEIAKFCSHKCYYMSNISKYLTEIVCYSY